LRLLDEAIEKEPTLRDAAALKIDLTAASGHLADAFAAYERGGAYWPPGRPGNTGGCRCG
jgi:hypothetical protein